MIVARPENEGNDNGENERNDNGASCTWRQINPLSKVQTKINNTYSILGDIYP